MNRDKNIPTDEEQQGYIDAARGYPLPAQCCGAYRDGHEQYKEQRVKTVARVEVKVV